MSESLVVCDVAEDLVEKLRKFRFRKETNNAAIIMKIDKDKQLVVLDEEHEGISPDELKDELPERQPRFIVYSYKYQHEDGRVSYPLCFIFSSPVGCKPEQQMMYAGSKNKLVQTAELTKGRKFAQEGKLVHSQVQGPFHPADQRLSSEPASYILMSVGA
uniref:Glia maturation factor beta n=1 Tax=Anas platyrhynchos platyrhynchos TaxID=8840 RepID=U3IBF1_ANAPP|nr:glia maturation factor beta isoform X1 [Anas platyrhynchos]